MNKQIIASQLASFGLDEVEINIYLYLLTNGSKTPLDLSRETSINRSRIYRYLDRLKAKKLIEEVNLGRGITLKASSPNSLELLISEKEQELRIQKEALPQLLKELTTLPSNLQNIFEIKYYHGLEGLKQMLWNQLSANKEILLYGYQTKNEIVGKGFAEKIRDEQVRRKITLYEIENELDEGEYLYTGISNWSKYFVPRFVSEEIIKIRQYTTIFNNTVSILNWLDGQQVGVEIINSQYASMQRQLFWSVWEKIAVKPNQPKLKAEGKRLEATKNRKT